jgi:hypothetical protein
MADLEIIKADLRKAIGMRKTGLIWYYRVGRCVLALIKASSFVRTVASPLAAAAAGARQVPKQAEMDRLLAASKEHSNPMRDYAVVLLIMFRHGCCPRRPCRSLV